MAYVVGALRTVMEWATVPVLAVAMCLPHGALVYWLSSSSVSLLQVPNPAMPSARSTEAHMQSSVCHPACLYNRRGFACEHGCWRPSALMSGHGLTSPQCCCAVCSAAAPGHQERAAPVLAGPCRGPSPPGLVYSSGDCFRACTR